MLDERVRGTLDYSLVPMAHLIWNDTMLVGRKPRMYRPTLALVVHRFSISARLPSRFSRLPQSSCKLVG